MYNKIVKKDDYMKSMIEKYSDMIYRIAISRTRKKEDAEDILQEVFLKLSKKMPNFENTTHEKAWIIRVTINCSKNLLNSSWIKKTISLDKEIIFSNEEIGDVYFSILKLPTKYRTVIHLFYYENLSLLDISNILKININTVKTHLSRAKQQLKTVLEGGLEDE